MDFDLPEDVRLLRETVGKFVDRELIPIEMNTLEGPELKPEVKTSLEAKARGLGLWQLDTPAEFGGQGLSLLALAVTNHYRRRLPYTFWRRAHYLNFAVWSAATVHGLGVGTDRQFVGWICDLLFSLQPQAQQHNVSLEKLGDLTTLSDRLRAEVAASKTLVTWIGLVSAWTRKPSA